MRSASDLMATARATMTKWPALWLPPIFMNMAQSLAGIPLTSTMLQALSGLMANMGALFINAGWLAMIGAALKDEKPSMGVFTDGLNRRWAAVLFGTLAFVLLLGAGLAALYWYGDRTYGFQAVRAWFDAFQALPPEKVNEALQPDKLPLVVKRWMYLAMVWMTFAAGTTFMLLYWQPLAVLREMPWWKAWLSSIKLVFTRFGLTASFALLHLIVFVAALSITAGRSAFLALFGLTMLLFIEIYFKILYAAVVTDAYPEPGTQVDLKA
jgi:hypothetical protein